MFGASSALDGAGTESQAGASKRMAVETGTNSDFFRYDVVTEKRTMILSAGTVNEAFTNAGLADSPGAARLFFMWNGRENEFYLSDGWPPIPTSSTSNGRNPP